MCMFYYLSTHFFSSFCSMILSYIYIYIYIYIYYAPSFLLLVFYQILYCHLISCCLIINKSKFKTCSCIVLRSLQENIRDLYFCADFFSCFSLVWAYYKLCPYNWWNIYFIAMLALLFFLPCLLLMKCPSLWVLKCFGHVFSLFICCLSGVLFDCFN
jgi:hypothetical protein